MWWALATAAAVGPVFLADTAGSRRFDRIVDHGLTATATVAEDYGGGDTVGLSYDHPDLGRIDDAEAFRSEVPAPEPGSRMEIAVGDADPYGVVLAGDRYPVESPGTWLGLAVAPLLVVPLRWLDVRRSRRLAAGADQSFLMLGVVARPRRRRGLRLHLFPLDAVAGDPPICTVRLLTSAGVPVGGPPVRVEVKGSPRPFGRVVGRVDGRVLLPRGRALGWSDRRAALPNADLVAPPVTTRVDPWRPPAPALLAAVVLGLVATGITLRNWRAAREVQDHGIPVVATITGNGADFSLDLTYRLPGDERRLDGSAPVDSPDDWQVGRHYPAHVDPSDPTRARLDATPYDPWEPITWSWLPFAAALTAWWLTRRPGPRPGAD